MTRLTKTNPLAPAPKDVITRGIQELGPQKWAETVAHGLQALVERRETLLRWAAEVQDSLRDIQQHQIEEQGDLDLAKEVLNEIQTMSKERTAQKEEITKPLFNLSKLIHDIYRPTLETLEASERLLKQKIAKGIKHLTDKQTKLLTVAGTAARQGDLLTARAALAAAPEATLPRGLSVRPVWKFRVTRPEIVPEEYLMLVVNTEKVQQAIDAGVRKIDGIEIYEEEIVANRR